MAVIVNSSGTNGYVDRSLGNHYSCVLYSYSYDGDGLGLCKVSGVKQGAWTMTIGDEGAKKPQGCNAICSDLISSGVEVDNGKPCTAT